MELKIEYLNKQELKPYANNAKIHTDEQIEQIRNSIEQFGFNDPISIWQDNEVIEGHGRLLAVMEMDDVTEVPVIRLDNLSDEERRAYMLAHNQLTMNTGFDFNALEKELDALEIDMSEFGFVSHDIDWDSVPDLDHDTYEEPTHNMLECPKCHHIDRDIHFKKAKGVEEENQNTDY